MTSDHSRIREQIKELFEASRETPGSPYDEGKMLWHLVSKPINSGSLHNTFKGKRRFSRFLRSLEAKFEICFAVKDWESINSLDQLEKRILYLSATPKASLASLQSKLKRRSNLDIVGIALFALSSLPAVMAVRLFGLVGWLVFLVPTVIIGGLYVWELEIKNFYHQLEVKIRSESAD